MTELPARVRGDLSDLLRRSVQNLFSLPGYRLTLAGRTPDTLQISPPDPWPGRADQGAAVLAERFHFTAWEPAAGGDIWNPPEAPSEWLVAMHGFVWLRDLTMLGGDESRQQARRLTADWIGRNDRWSLPAWRSDVTAARIVSWLSHYDTFFASGEDRFRQAVLGSIAVQLRHLDRAWRLETAGADRIAALKGLIYGSLCLGSRAKTEQRLAMLEHELERQVLADGGHAERNPGKLLNVLQDLLEIRAALGVAQFEAPGSIQQAIDRMAPMLRYLRGGDGMLGRFNGAGGEDPLILSAILEQASPRGKPAARAPAFGFERMSAGKLTILVDSGAPAESPWDVGAHAGTLSLEVTVGRERLIVNCGAAPCDGERWQMAERATAAHSTITVSDRNSSELLANGRIGGRVAKVTAEGDSADGATLVDMSHDGYLRSDGITHRRRIFLSDDGADLRGEDTLTGRGGVPFAVRFHLHPAVDASLLQSGKDALLRLPRGGGWRLRCSEPLALSESIYFEDAPEPRRTSQIVISGVTGDGATTIKWALQS
ncbi:MAG: heparinase II/III family protein [Proteobacteria bacterium]|nr:heparinase II/III family protein [Pseudomonadota bacterium]